jgi:hypothetical protein
VDKVASTKKALMVRIELFVIFRYWREPAARQCLPSRALFEDAWTRWSKAERAKMTLPKVVSAVTNAMPLRLEAPGSPQETTRVGRRSNRRS